MKKPGPVPAILTPDASGWRVLMADTPDQLVASLEEAVELVPENAILELALPCSSAIIESQRLPTTDSTELVDMLQIQLEKTLTSPLDDVSTGFEIIEQTENETRLLSVAASHSCLDSLCEPLRKKHRMPERVGLQALRVPAMCNPETVCLVIWPEQEQFAVSLIERGKLAWVQATDSVDGESFINELPGMLIAAELDGANTDFSEIQVSQGCDQLMEPLGKHFGKPVVLLAPDSTAFHSKLNLLPENWRYEASRRERKEKLVSRLYIAAAIYLVLLLSSFVYLAWLNRDVRNAQRQSKEMEPRFAGIALQEERWNSLAPSVEREMFIAEVLHHLTQHCNPAVVQFTAFTSTPKEWVLHAEANNSDEAFNFVQKLKTEPGLQFWDLPKTTNFEEVKDRRVKFTVNGKAIQRGVAK